MIAWFGPAVLLLLFSAAPGGHPQTGTGPDQSVLAEELAAAVVRLPAPHPRPIRFAPRFAGRMAAPPVLRRRSVREAGLPSPRAP